jgi:multiple sugar transport system substrate-binding protein
MGKTTAPMPGPPKPPRSRRDFIRLVAGAAAMGPFFAFPGRARANGKTLRVAKWAHFLPEFDVWFDEMASEWGLQHDTTVIVDRVHVEEVHATAMAEAKGGSGHDLFMFPWPPAEFQRQLIDHTEIYERIASKYGNVDRLGHRSTYDPATGRYFAFADSWIPAPFQYLEDYWRAVDIPLGPIHYDGLRSGGKRLRDKLGIPTGLPLTPSLESNVALHSLLFAFNSRILDVDGNTVIDKTHRTVAALDYVKALHRETGAPEQLTWGPSANVQAVLAKKASCTINSISLLRTAENKVPDVAKVLRLSPPLLGSGGAGVLGLPHVTSCSGVWNFAENKGGAQQFLVDLIDSSKTIYDKSEGCNLPIFQKTLPNLIVRLESDPKADPPGKYKELKDALHWTHNLGLPGYANPVAMEVFNTFVIPRMFLGVVRGGLSAEEAARAAAAEIGHICEKWKRA